jgi:hypothetical protein
MKYSKYTLVDNMYKQMYSTIDLLDLARKIITLNEERIIINNIENRNFYNQEGFNYHLIVEEVELKEMK